MKRHILYTILFTILTIGVSYAQPNVRTKLTQLENCPSGAKYVPLTKANGDMKFARLDSIILTIMDTTIVSTRIFINDGGTKDTVRLSENDILYFINGLHISKNDTVKWGGKLIETTKIVGNNYTTGYQLSFDSTSLTSIKAGQFYSWGKTLATIATDTAGTIRVYTDKALMQKARTASPLLHDGSKTGADRGRVEYAPYALPRYNPTAVNTNYGIRFTGDTIGNWVSIDSIIGASGGGGGGENHGGVLYVATTGSDFTGVRGDEHKPFRTVQGALYSGQFQSGDLIHVYPGNYIVGTTGSGEDRTFGLADSCTIIGAWGVTKTINIFLSSGATLTQSASDQDAKLFNYTFMTATSQTINIFGDGEISLQNCTTAGKKWACKLPNAPKFINLTINLNKFTNATNFVEGGNKNGKSRIIVHVNELLTIADVVTSMLSTGESFQVNKTDSIKNLTFYLTAKLFRAGAPIIQANCDSCNIDVQVGKIDAYLTSYPYFTLGSPDSLNSLSCMMNSNVNISVNSWNGMLNKLTGTYFTNRLFDGLKGDSTTVYHLNCSHCIASPNETFINIQKSDAQVYVTGQYKSTRNAAIHSPDGSCVAFNYYGGTNYTPCKGKVSLDNCRLENKYGQTVCYNSSNSGGAYPQIIFNNCVLVNEWQLSSNTIDVVSWIDGGSGGGAAMNMTFYNSYMNKAAVGAVTPVVSAPIVDTNVK